MKLAFSTLAFSLLLGSAQSTGPVVGTACLSACLATCIVGLCGGCAIQCTITFACYDDETTMETKSGVKKIQDIKKGDHVLSIMDDKENWSEVTLNMNINVPAPGYYIEALNPVSGEQYKFHVTANHNVPSIDASEDFLVQHSAIRNAGRMNVFKDLAKVVAASDLDIGNVLQVMSPTNKDVSLAKVTSIQSKSLDSKNVLFTNDGTVLSNGVLTAASCDIPMKNTSLKQHMEKTISTSAYYTCVEESLSSENIKETFSKASDIGMDNDEVYATDLFAYLLKHCGGIYDIKPDLLQILDMDISPTALDNASILNLALKEKVKIFDANSDNVVDHIENPALSNGMTQSAIEMNPYLCEKCYDPIDINKFNTSDLANIIV